MQIHAHEALEYLILQVEAQVEAALQERRELGLNTPDDFDVNVHFHKHSIDAEAGISIEGRSEINIYVANMTAPVYTKEFSNNDFWHALDDMSRYTNRIENLFIKADLETKPELDENNLLFSFLSDPKAIIEQFESNLGEGLDDYKATLSKEGYDYDAIKETLLENFEVIKREINGMFHYISEAYSRTDATTIEHELDHLAFCKSKHTEIVRKKKLEYNKLLNKVSEGQDEYEDRVKEVGVEFVYINVDHLTLTELRAHFFNVVPQGERTKADYEVAKEEVFSRFEKGYVKKDLPKRNFFYLINDLNDPELEGMDEATVKCIAKKFYESIHDPDATFYNGFKQEDVNQGVVDYFFDTKLPEFKQGIEAKARLAVDAFAKAFADDPTRFNEADAEAETFDQYVAICNGE